MRIINLGDDFEAAKQHFGTIRNTTILGLPPAGLEGFLNLSKAQNTLDAISIERQIAVEGHGAQIVRELKEGVTQIVLEDGPYELLKSRFFGAEIQWFPEAARRIVQTYKLFCDAKQVTPEELNETQ
jgi:hypothetical protein